LIFRRFSAKGTAKIHTLSFPARKILPGIKFALCLDLLTVEQNWKAKNEKGKDKNEQ
jgi:hypothetical protein